MHTFMHMQLHVHVLMHWRARAHTHARTHTNVDTRTHTHTHTHTYLYAHLDTHIQGNDVRYSLHTSMCVCMAVQLSVQLLLIVNHFLTSSIWPACLGGEGLRPWRPGTGGHQDHQKQETFPQPGPDWGQTPRAHEPSWCRKQVLYRWVVDPFSCCFVHRYIFVLSRGSRKQFH